MDAHYLAERRAALQSPSLKRPCPRCPGGAEMLQEREMFVTDVGLGTELVMDKLGADFPSSGWSQIYPRLPGNLEVPEAPALTGCGSAHPLVTSALAVAGFQSSLLFRILSSWVLGYQDVIGLCPPHTHMLKS